MYKPTDKNALVVDHYSKLGFSKVGGDHSGMTEWELDVDAPGPEGAPMTVLSKGFIDLQASVPA